MAVDPNRLNFLFSENFQVFNLNQEDVDRVSWSNDEVARAIMEHKDTLNDVRVDLSLLNPAALGTKRLAESIEHLTHLRNLSMKQRVVSENTHLVRETVTLFLGSLSRNPPRHGRVDVRFVAIDIDDEVLSYIPSEKVEMLVFGNKCRLPCDLSSLLSRNLADCLVIHSGVSRCKMQTMTRFCQHYYQHLTFTNATSSFLRQARDFVTGNKRLAKIEFDFSDDATWNRDFATTSDKLELLSISCASEVSVNMLYGKSKIEELGKYLSRDNRIDALTIGPFIAYESSGSRYLNPILLGLRSNDKVKRLTIRDYSPDDNDNIRDFLVHNTSLQALEISMKSIPPNQHMLMRKTILAGLRKNRTLKNLCFHLERMDWNGVAEVAECLRDHPSISSVRIVFGRIPNGFHELTQLSITREHPLELVLAYEPPVERFLIRDLIAIAEAVEARARIGQLSVKYPEYDQLSKDSTQALTRTIRSLSENMHLKSLKLDHASMHPSVLVALAETIPSMVSLEHLELTWPERKVPWDSFWSDKFLTALKTSSTLAECTLYGTRASTADVFPRMAWYYGLRNRVTTTMKSLPRCCWPDLFSRLLEEDTIGQSNVMLLLKTSPSVVEKLGLGGMKRSANDAA